MEAAMTWVGAVMNVVGLALMVGAIDLILANAHETTVTEFLRQYTLWYWIPFLGIVLLFIALGIHLYMRV